MNHRIIPSFIQELLEVNIPVTLTKDSFVVDGFYKSGTVEVKCIGEYSWMAVARYGEHSDIESLEDIVRLNYNWWQRGKDRYEGWSQPDSRWVDLLLQFGYIEKEIIPAQTIYK